MNVGLIGCGAIGKTLAQAIAEGKTGDIRLVAVCDIDKIKVEQLKESLGLSHIFMTTEPDEIIARDDLELIIETASQEVVRAFAEKILNAGKDIMIMSVGALRDNELLMRLERVAKEKKVKVFVPSGAICGLDGVKAASVKGITSAEITTIKNPKGLEGAPYLAENNIDLSGLTEPKVVYQGKAREAAKGFPKNVNVAVALSLAGIGVDRTMVKIIADPEADRTQHEIRVKGEFGEMHTVVRNLVHPENPKTSYLAALSAIRTLRKLTELIQVGT